MIGASLRRGLALLTLLGPATVAACDGEAAVPPVDLCKSVQCINGPPATCSGATKVSFAAVGQCVVAEGAALCTYPELPRQNCEGLGKICQQGQCVVPPIIPCEGVVCDEAPAPDCNGAVAQIYEPDGACNPAIPPGGKCEYPVDATLDCAAQGRECRAGACIDPSDFPCDPNPCDVLPLGSCSPQGIPTGWQAPGACTHAADKVPVCTFTATTLLACPAGSTCVAGACAAASATPASPGDLVISEIMRNPSSADDAGEWVELYNPGTVARPLAGCLLRDDGEDSYTFPATGSPTVPAKGYLVLGRSADATANGGFSADHVYSSFVLANGGDEVEVVCGGVTIDRVAYADTGWPYTVAHSLSLSAGALTAGQNDSPAVWCEGAARFGRGTEYGTPRRANPVCP